MGLPATTAPSLMVCLLGLPHLCSKLEAHTVCTAAGLQDALAASAEPSGHTLVSW